MIRNGIDILNIERFKKLNQNIKDRIFSKKELNFKDIRKLAGIFALKEAFFKALDIKVEWLEIEVLYKKTGKPYFNISNKLNKRINSIDCSLSHEDNYVIASVVLEIKS